ncbi:hypothetical protein YASMINEVIRUS_257 [Yasminevirus sp. GU-2018]|uniref:Uncharacterized protein n=1 Tax=Yasminevirus sp. GU-2018 TaxID=2420051 RepID=A0A5K0U8I5_9VIRU|nr:hypothetical protein YASMINEVIRUS_257 [Yasminevirus sp. GU-2018]
MSYTIVQVFEMWQMILWGVILVAVYTGLSAYSLYTVIKSYGDFINVGLVLLAMIGLILASVMGGVGMGLLLADYTWYWIMSGVLLPCTVILVILVLHSLYRKYLSG